MKNLARKSLVVFGLMTMLSSFANEKVVTLKEKETNVTHMRFENVLRGSSLSIVDQYGLVLYNEAIKQNGDYSKGFDLTTLPDGDYFFELNSEFKIVVRPFNVHSNEVVFDKNLEESIYKPMLRTKDDLVFVSRIDMENTALSYKIYYEDNYELVDAVSFEEFEKVEKVYDFSNSERGTYIFVFQFDGRKYTKAIKI